MTIPVIRTIEGQGGNIQIYSSTAGGKITIQVRNWRIQKVFHNADVTVTCSGGWAEYKRCLASWSFEADWPYDAITQRVGIYDGVQLINGVYVPIGLEYPVPGACIFQIGAAGAVTNPNSIPIQYQGTALISSDNTQNPATDVVTFHISGQGTGALIGPVSGIIS